MKIIYVIFRIDTVDFFTSDYNTRMLIEIDKSEHKNKMIQKLIELKGVVSELRYCLIEEYELIDK